MFFVILSGCSGINYTGVFPGKVRRSVMITYQDKVLVCKDCGSEFTFTAGEQEFYSKKGFENEPSRCKTCRDARKSQSPRGSSSKSHREMYEAICAECGKTTRVPFKPHLGKPVYCSECFAKR